MHLAPTVRKQKKMVSMNMNYIIGRKQLLITQKKAKHIKSYAFYNGDDQVYEQHLALSLEASLQKLIGNSQLEEIKIIDSNPANNPQPPYRIK